MLIALEVGHVPVEMCCAGVPLARRCNSEGSYAILAKWPHT